jgi:hypothetical protein
MKAMWAGFAAIFVIAGLAAVVLNGVGTTTADRFSSAATRLN